MKNFPTDVNSVRWYVDDLNHAFEWFNESIFDRLAKKLLKEAAELVLVLDNEYHHADLARYCAIKELDLFIAVPEVVKGMQCWQYLRIGSNIFQRHKVDGSNSRITYKLTMQTSLFETEITGSFSPMIKQARISECKKYRYGLLRKWNNELPMVMFMMLNPSTADADKDDPTIRRCIAFAKSWGFGSLFVGNLFAYRATNPRDLLTVEDPVGPSNLQWNALAAKDANMIVCAWGNSPIVGALEKKLGEDFKPLVGIDKLHYIELSKGGTPKHPLYLKGDLMPVEYEIPVSRLS